MDQGLGLKNTHLVDVLASSSDFRIAEDNSGHVYESKETEGAFILTAHLEGYRKVHVDVDYSEDRTRIIIGLEKPVQEKKKKVFRIPDGVDLSRIKAKFDELESTLRIDMPKVKKGVVGLRIVEDCETETKPAATEKSNPLRTPLIIVGSALLVSIVLLAINRIRNRKRWISFAY